MSGIEAASAVRTRRHDEEDHPPAKAPPPRGEVSTAALAQHDRSAIDFVRNVGKPTNDDILYIGMRDGSAGTEMPALGGHLTRIAPSRSTVVTLDEKSFDLAKPAGMHEFAAALGAKYALGPETVAGLETLLKALKPEVRDEIARIAMVWAPGELGGTIPSRMVLSGHSFGGEVYGDDVNAGMLAFGALQALAKVLPAAALQIEDIHISGCNTERQIQNDVGGWTSAFKNVKTIWAYAGTAPDAPAGDLAAWERATRGRNDTLDNKMLLQHFHATAWRDGRVLADTVSFGQRKINFENANDRFDEYLSGETPIDNPHGPAEQDYIAYQQLAAHPQTPPEKRAQAFERAHQMLCLRFWNGPLRAEIAAHFGAEIGFDLSKMTRKEFMAEVERRHPAPGSLLDRIANLDPKTIPVSWCH